MCGHYTNMCRPAAAIPLLVPKADYVDVTPPSNSYYTCDTQILRSVSLWSNGIETEASIQVWCIGNGQYSWSTMDCSWTPSPF